MEASGATATPATATVARTKPRVLIVDDTPDTARVIRARLHHNGMEVVTAHDGPTALEIAGRQPLDLVLVDVSMPGMDGYEVCQHLKAKDLTKDIPVIFLTANLASEDRTRGFEVGGHDYIGKPVDQAELLGRTTSALRIKAMMDDLKNHLEEVEGQMQLQTLQSQKMNSIQQALVAALWQRIFGQLAGNVTQEINRPLTAAISSVRLMMIEERLPAGMRERLYMLELNLRQATDSLRRLLMVSQPQRQPQGMYLGQLLEDLAELMKNDLHKSGVNVSLQLDPTCQWKGMPSELSRAIIYILTNAIEAVSGVENPQITIKVERDEEWQYIRIADNGTGIAASFIDRIFEQSFTTKAPPHTGAGLYLANAIVKAASGTISAQSPAGDASTEVTITLPLNMQMTAWVDV